MPFRTPLATFSTLWALAAALHHLEKHPTAGWPIYPFCALLFFRPDSVGVVALFAGVHALLSALDLPAPANHTVVSLLVDAILLVGCARASREPNAALRPRRLWESVQGPIVATVLVVYGFALLHKLNSSFLDPRVSCAVTQATKVFRLHGLAPPTNAAVVFAPLIPVTLILEAAIPLLLAVGRTAALGAILGLVFHTALGWAQFFDFATTITALYLFFFRWDVLERALSRIPGFAETTLAGGLAILGGTSFVFRSMIGDPTIATFQGWTWTSDTIACLAWTIAIWPVLLPIFASVEPGSARGRWRGAWLAWALPVLAAVNGVTPYVGLKTVANYSMFSNLRTEGGRSNHLLIPASTVALTDHQTDLVRVTALRATRPPRWRWDVALRGGDRWLRRNSRWLSDREGRRIPFFELRRTLQVWRAAGLRDIVVEYERNGKKIRVEDVASDPDLARPLSPLERRLLAYRAVGEDDRPTRCRW